MRARSFPLLVVPLAVLTILGTAWYAIQAVLEVRAEAQQQRAEHAAEQEIPEPDEELVERMEAILPHVGRLGRPQREPVAGELRYELLGFDPEAATARPDEDAPDAERFDTYTVSMTYVSSGRSFAVIDGELYAEGDTLPDSDVRVRTITPEQVLVAGRRARQWLEVERVGPMQPVLADAPEVAVGETPEPAREEAREREAEEAEVDDELREVMQGVEALRGLQEGGER